MSISYLEHGTTLPAVVAANNPSDDLVDFIQTHRQSINDGIIEHGAVLFRGFNISNEAKFESVVSALSSQRMTYDYGSTPRTHLGSGIYTATEYPSSLQIPLHNECSYQTTWPRYVVFCCTIAATQGGQTPLGDMQKVRQALDDDVFDEFLQKGVRYVRHYRPYVDVPWQSVFQTTDESDLEKICADNDIQMTWLDPQLLRTVQVCQGVAQHPVTNDMVFFNQAHLFHLSTHSQEAIDALIEAFSEEKLPRTSFFGDGSQIPNDTVSAINDAFKNSEIQFDWQQGDVLLIDNMRVAHGRREFSGDRKVLTALLDPIAR